jgi:hypothetical protein
MLVFLNLCRTDWVFVVVLELNLAPCLCAEVVRIHVICLAGDVRNATEKD